MVITLNAVQRYTDEAFFIKMADIVQRRAVDFNRLERQMLTEL